jgi:CDP-diacylglycerol--serine O-phosphatidyltransferase
MNFLKQNIPNAITCLNLLFGCIAIIYAFQSKSPHGDLGALTAASWFIFAAAIADFFDGMAARALKVHSDIGKELDSLADVVSFGVAPGMILFQLINNPPYSWIALMIPVFAAIRLAKFNIDTRQTTYFIGLPTPANGLFIASFPLIIITDNSWNTFYYSQARWATLFFVVIAILCSVLMVSGIRLLSLKMKNTSWSDNKARYILCIVSLLAFFFLWYAAIPLILLFYILLSSFYKKSIITNY